MGHRDAMYPKAFKADKRRGQFDREKWRTLPSRARCGSQLVHLDQLTCAALVPPFDKSIGFARVFLDRRRRGLGRLDHLEPHTAIAGCLSFSAAPGAMQFKGLGFHGARPR
jgi:hypothetical protein